MAPFLIQLHRLRKRFTWGEKVRIFLLIVLMFLSLVFLSDVHVKVATLTLQLFLSAFLSILLVAVMVFAIKRRRAFVAWAIALFVLIPASLPFSGHDATFATSFAHFLTERFPSIDYYSFLEQELFLVAAVVSGFALHVAWYYLGKRETKTS